MELRPPKRRDVLEDGIEALVVLEDEIDQLAKENMPLTLE
jgi:hypothetical protein